MALSFTILGSGSTGNATLVSAGDTHILVDVGLSGKETARRLRECGVEPDRISAIVLSHEHIDHTRGVAPFVKCLNIPVYMIEAAFRQSQMKVDPGKLRPIQAGRAFDIQGIQFTPFSVPHDAVDPIGLTIEKAGVKLAIVLDLGAVNMLAVERLRGCDGIIMESNHDPELLKISPYPMALKQRIQSQLGHLSNRQVAEYLASDFDGRARHVLLAHLSQTNNNPHIARGWAREALDGRSTLGACQTKLEVAEPDRISATYRF